jgi:chemotaxis signal transduction protein
MRDVLEILLVQLNNKTLGINLKEIREVIPYVKHFHIPKIPSLYLGLINVRGEIWILVDFCKILFKKRAPIDIKRNKILITKHYERQISFLVDNVEDILELTKGEINKIKKEGKGKECFSGEIYYKKKIIPIINLKEIILKEVEEIEEINFNYFIE